MAGPAFEWSRVHLAADTGTAQFTVLLLTSVTARCRPHDGLHAPAVSLAGPTIGASFPQAPRRPDRDRIRSTAVAWTPYEPSAPDMQALSRSEGQWPEIHPGLETS